MLIIHTAFLYYGVIFQRTGKSEEFREVLIDIEENSTAPYYFREVLAPGPNPNSKMLIHVSMTYYIHM